MAKDTRQVDAKSDNPQGMNDNSPEQVVPSWYQVSGCRSTGQQFLERKPGKSLIHKIPGAILNIERTRERIYIETTHALYMFVNITDAVPPLP